MDAYQLQDADFSEKNAGEYRIILQAAHEGITVAVLDDAKKRFVALKHLPQEPALDEDTFLPYLEKLFKNDPWLSLKPKAFVFMPASSAGTLVPKALYEDNHARVIAKLNFRNGNTKQLEKSYFEKPGAYFLYQIDGHITTLLANRYKDYSILHPACPFIKHATGYPYSKNAIDRIFADYYQGQLLLAHTRGSRLLLFNNFGIDTEDDLLYHVLNAHEQQGLSTSHTPLMFSGEVSAKGGLYKRLQAMHGKLRLLKLNTEYKYTQEIHKAPEPLFINIFNAASCG